MYFNDTNEWYATRNTRFVYKETTLVYNLSQINYLGNINWYYTSSGMYAIVQYYFVFSVVSLVIEERSPTLYTNESNHKSKRIVAQTFLYYYKNCTTRFSISTLFCRVALRYITRYYTVSYRILYYNIFRKYIDHILYPARSLTKCQKVQEIDHSNIYRSWQRYYNIL